ncbi:MAG TPA: tetratricopeptide repeat protein [Blastocatellia bacterium]|nr:tetratricopeptide repeat protein [Blastocatellia bacterium]
MAKTSRRNRIAVKDMKFRNDPMIRFYDRTQDWLQERGRPIIIAIAALAGAVVLYTIFDFYTDYRDSKAKAAFAEAYDRYKAPVMDSTVTTAAPPTGRSYTDEKVKWQETAEAFERLANDYSGYYGTKGRYYAAAAYLHLDRDKGVQMLEQLAKEKDPSTADLARMALAENHAGNGEYDQAIAEYEKLLNSSFVPRQGVQLALGRAYEKANQTEKAVDAYFEVAKVDRSTASGAEAERRLSALAPDRIKDLPAPTTIPLFGQQ